MDRGGSLEAVGVVSFGYSGCAMKGMVGVYADVYGRDSIPFLIIIEFLLRKHVPYTDIRKWYRCIEFPYIP